MAELTNVVIAIQARSTSARFPRKVYERIGNKTMLDHVIDACNGSARYTNLHGAKRGLIVTVAIAIPVGDPIKQDFKSRAYIVEGSEDDVLSRYKKVADELRADYVVRVTSDCPLIPNYLISKSIVTALKNQYDYYSNVDPRFRTTADGMDCEVMSAKLLDYTHQTATDPQDREHVTPLMRRDPPAWARVGTSVGYQLLADRKLSVDTPEDLERVRAEYEIIKEMAKEAERLYGKSAVHRF